MVGCLWSFSGVAGVPFGTLLGGVHKVWPGVSEIAVVCDKAASAEALGELSSAASGMKLLVVDVKGPQDMGKAIAALSSRKPDLVVLLPGDRVAGDGSSAASFLIQRMAAMKIPVVATTGEGLHKGAVLGLEGGRLAGNPKAASAVGVTLPAGL
jgi:ABC-type uncharacterized transport system substrate-binding protein